MSPVPTRVRRVVLASIGLVLTSGLPGPAEAYSRPRAIEMVSLTPDGRPGNARSDYLPSLSADGRLVAFGSEASDLVPNDTNGQYDVFVRDRRTGHTRLVSVSSSGEQANIGVSQPVMSGNGRYVAFWGGASNLVPGDTNGVEDVFVHDLVTSETERVSVATDGTQGDAISLEPVLSYDGRYVAFWSHAENLVPGDHTQASDVFVHDRHTGETELVSHLLPGHEIQGFRHWNQYPQISADGRFVAFQSDSDIIVPDDTNELTDAFVYDRETKTTQMISVSSDEVLGNNRSWQPTISADGRYVAFWSDASNLVPTDTNGAPDAFVRDLATGTTRRISVTSEGVEGGDYSFQAFISADGSKVAFWSGASDLDPEDTPPPTPLEVETSDIYIHDLASGITERITETATGAEGDSHSQYGRLSADGRYVAFNSNAANLVPQVGLKDDMFVADVGPRLGVSSVRATSSDGMTAFSGDVTWPGSILATATDGVDDARVLHPAVDITGATVIQRPEAGDLFVRVAITDLDGAAGRCEDVLIVGTCTESRSAGSAATYTVSFARAGVRHEARIDASGARLFECKEACVPAGDLQGSVGHVGHEVVLSIPDSGADLDAVTVSTSVGPATADTVLDRLALGDIARDGVQLSAGAGPANAAFEQVELEPVSFANGRFSWTTGQGAGRVWIEACLGAECARHRIDL